MVHYERNGEDVKVVHVSDGDWEGFYVDGECVIQDHVVDPRRLIKALGIEIEEVECDDEWLATQGYLPNKLEDVKLRELEATKPRKTKKGKKRAGG